MQPGNRRFANRNQQVGDFEQPDVPEAEAPIARKLPRRKTSTRTRQATTRKSKFRLTKILNVLGPGIITGAADDDPSGIGTYSSVGAQFGYSMLWTMLFTYPLMAAIQEISARIGRVTGHGIAGNMRNYY